MVTLIMTLLGGFLDFFSQLQIVRLLYGNLFCELALFFRKGEAELIGEREILPQRIAYGAYQNQASVFGKPFSQDWFIIGHQQVREQGGGENGGTGQKQPGICFSVIYCGGRMPQQIQRGQDFDGKGHPGKNYMKYFLMGRKQAVKNDRSAEQGKQ